MSEAQELQQRSTGRRLLQLDSLRGIAAVTVVLYHLRCALVPTPPHWPMALPTSGLSAVILFFVLSGYVLSLPFWRSSSAPYPIYLVRRICRIYLPFAAAASISIAGAWCFQNDRPPLTSWFALTWHGPVQAGMVAKQFLMAPMATFNTAFWSLTYEMEMSICMPLLCLLMLRSKPILVTAILALLASLRLSLQVAFLFSLGASLAYYEHAVRKIFARLGTLRWIVLALSFFLYFNFPALLSSGPGTIHRILVERMWLPAGIGAAGILVCSLHIVPFARLLEHSLPEYLGRISYSLYLTHSIVLFALFDLLYGHLPTPLLVALVVLIAFPTGHLFCILVEEPAMRLGKSVAEKMKRQRSLQKV